MLSVLCYFPFHWSLSLSIYIYIYIYIDHVERKVLKYENHKLRERKVKTLTRNWRDHRRTGIHKQTETISRYFDRHGHLFQSEESKCLWTHDKDGVTREFTKGFNFYWWCQRMCVVNGKCSLRIATILTNSMAFDIRRFNATFILPSFQ